VFSSLDRIDVVLEPAGGRQTVVQTDHREAAEVAAEPELSTLFAVIRVLNPVRAAEPGLVRSIQYDIQHEPPGFLADAIRAAGGSLTVDRQARPADVVPPLDGIVSEAFAGLARRTATDHGVEVTQVGLAVVERSLAAAAPDPEDDEFAYWSAVVKLGAFAGEVVRAANGGEWRVVETGTLPFALATRFRGEPATANPLGKAIKQLENGDEDSVSSLVALLGQSP